MKYALIALIIIFATACTTNDVVLPSQVKLTSVTQYTQNNSQTGFSVGQKIEYTYSPTGQLSSERLSQFDLSGQSYLFSYTTYSYKNSLLDRIEKQIIGNPNQTVTTYTYNNNKISRINVDDEVDAQADITYRGDTVEVFYKYSNGRFFTYRFDAKGGNISYEKTIDDDNRLSSEISSTYDNGKNPLTLLGYTDFLFVNFSSNNKIKTTSAYYTNAFPSLTPVKYEYEYNEKNYPVTQITTLQSTSSGTTGKTKTVFEYN